MAKDLKGKGKKKKDPDKAKAPRIYVSRRSRGSTLKRIKVRQETHRHRVERKQAKLIRRCEDLVKLLGSQGKDYYDARQAEMSVGKLHRYLRRTARRRGIIGPPLTLRKRRSRAEKGWSVDNPSTIDIDEDQAGLEGGEG